MQQVGAEPYRENFPGEMRQQINQRIMQIEAPTPVVGEVSEALLHQEGRETPLRIYRPQAQENDLVILFIHGGGWVGGSLETHDHLARYLCAGTQAVVVSVGYTNAPEAKFPFALEQCYDVLNWIAKERPFAGKGKIAVVGDSGGGNMAAALSLMTKERSGPLIHLQVLINPAFDLTGASIEPRSDDTLEKFLWMVSQYLKNPSDALHPYASPLLATDLRGLPPATLLVAEYDFVRNEGELYAKRLMAAGVPAVLYCQKGVGHLAGHGARAAVLAQESLDVATKSLREASR